MNVLTVQLSKNPFHYVPLLYNVHKIIQKYTVRTPYATTVDAIDAFTMEILYRHRSKMRQNPFKMRYDLKFFMGTDNMPYDFTRMSVAELDAVLLKLISKNNDKEVTNIITSCLEKNITISDLTLMKLFRTYSLAGKPDSVEILQKYCLKVNYNLYKRNGEFLHYLAKAQCMKGNSERGLIILRDCYERNEGLRTLYRTIFRELIQDSVLNRSEASLVIFKKYVLELSEKYGDSYPLVCFWHICWSSSWFSDQMLSNDLLESSTTLLGIVKDKATAFSISILRQEYNEDAVLRLLQTLLKYDLMEAYVKVLQILFNHKLRNRDIRGCTEIIRNCEALGVTLPSDQQGRYIKLLITGKTPIVSETKQQATKPAFKNFKFKF